MNRQQIYVDLLYVDVYVLERATSKSYATIPHLLKNSNPRNDFERLGLNKRDRRTPGFDAATQYSRLMVLGKPGSGKTTFLRHLAVANCKGEFLGDRIPVLIELRFIANISEFNLLNHIHEEFRLADIKQSKEILQQGKVVIFLDGLDEISSQFRRKIQDHIIEFSRNYYNTYLIITCRTQTSEYILPNFDYVEVADFNPQQVEQFAKNWFAALADTQQQAIELTQKFIAKLELPENKQTAELAVTPILLSLTCWVFNDLQDLPIKRSDLYERGIDLLLSKWDDRRGIRRDSVSEIYRQLTLTQRKQLLSYIAKTKFEQEQYILFEQNEIQGYIAEYLHISNEDAEVVLQEIEAQHGLLIERSHGIWSFSHLTFQEYFVASFFIYKNNYEELTKHIIENHWHEVFLLAIRTIEKPEKLLRLMKHWIETFIKNDVKLQHFLTWVYEKTSLVKSLFPKQAIRSFYFNLGLSRLNSLGLYCANDISALLNKVDDFDSYSNDVKTSITGNLPYDLMLDLNLMLCFDPKLNFKYNKPLQEVLQELTNQIPNLNTEDEWENENDEWWEEMENLEWWYINGKTWTDKLRATIIEHRNICHNWHFSTQQKELLQQYYDANRLLLECLHSSCTVSDKVRQEMENNLLLPIAEIKKRKREQKIE